MRGIILNVPITMSYMYDVGRGWCWTDSVGRNIHFTIMNIEEYTYGICSKLYNDMY